MASSNVAEFAAELQMPTNLLLEILQEAGVQKAGLADVVSETDKARLLHHLRRKHGSNDEGKRTTRYSTLFISYGGCDELIARQINESLKSRGIKTWFFPDDSVPGEKLHRVMHVGVNSYDRVLLVCSRTSLGRSGVLNELERVLEREAREGGGDILLPITIDDFVFSDWKPQNEDVATQVRSRVICRIPDPGTDSIIFEKTMDRLEAMSLYTTSLSRHDSEKARLLSMT